MDVTGATSTDELEDLDFSNLNRPGSAGGQRLSVRLPILVAPMSVGLLASAILGIVIALTNRSMRRMSVIVLVAGAALPLPLLPG